jgi:acetolactate synthase-1/2/3 large subunit
MTALSGAQALVRAIEREGVEVVFGIPGGAVLPVYDALFASPLRHVSARHEQGAGHMAEGYAQATGRVGVVFTTSGPGATNLITPLHDALMDSVPLVAVTGQVASSSIGDDAFQEADTTGLAMHCAKHSYLIQDPEEIIDVVHEAFFLAASGRPGPVVIDLPKDVLNATVRWREAGPIALATRPAGGGHSREIHRAVAMLMEAERPVLYVGGGVIKSSAHAELLRLAEAANAPVVTTLMARGAIPDGHRLALGMPGMHGTYAATTAMQRADVLVALGARFDDRVTGNPETFAPSAEVVHVDIDPVEIGKVRKPQIAIVGDARAVLAQFLSEIERNGWNGRPPTRESWLESVQGWQRDYPLRYDQRPDGPIKAQYVIERICAATAGEAIVVSGVGQHQMWASQFWQFSRPRSWISSGGLGTMGFALPAAIGAKVGKPDDVVLALDGDGGFQMTLQELITAATEGILIKVAVFNNGGYGMVRQWQSLFYEGRYSAVDLDPRIPDYVRLVEAMGCIGLRASTPEDVDPTIQKWLSIDDRPAVAEFEVDRDEMCFPMVRPGGSNDDVLFGPEGLR